MIKIIVVGKIKDKSLEELINYYKKQVPRKLEFINIKDEPVIEGMNKEGLKIMSKIKPTDYVIALAINGNHYSSEEFAELINKIETDINKDIIFIIGGSFGLAEEVMRRANLEISFSKMTFPHQLMRLILIEQIYRGYSIINNHPYHK